MIALLPGFLTGLSLIIAIGAQNAFVIKQGLLRQHVLLIVLICAISDAVLIFLGTGGLGALVQSNQGLLEVIRWFGVAYLTWFGIKSVKSAFTNQSLEASESPTVSALKVATTALALTWLNPHVYLDTVILLGSVANQFDSDRWYFAIGASVASVLWFTVIGFGARAASKYMSRPIFWKILDSLIAVVMFSIAITLAFFNF
ncbi:L-lysine exporter family protein LysE/ArgO [Candidatus Planktophila sulfonica]|uniref:L-lysine exporter family protein LysE/ArgO n=1 Tax=Candidatus Planktophila sulfonica TaxID=1884904 RepID=A0A249KGS7_9ACTN|nr:LysE/ArgO family amino acid transporter [Candidatus Planktophila sulfonica]ASY16013.1 L-lysine exporter family protein LysE/ArgO [Candidatus Planktophila sulfonica]